MKNGIKNAVRKLDKDKEKSMTKRLPKPDERHLLRNISSEMYLGKCLDRKGQKRALKD